MAFNMNLWKVSSNSLQEITKIRLDSENRLEDWIANDPSILGMELLIIGRQVQTSFGGRIDLLALDRQGNLVILELKRDRTPREIVAQILDYASWAKSLTESDISSVAGAFLNNSLAAAFSTAFDDALPDNLNTNHSMIIVASELDESSERIVQYLANEYKVSINALFFTFFKDDPQEFMGRAWLMDPKDVQEKSESRKRGPWSGFYFVNVGEGAYRNWDDNRRYGYISAGQGRKASGALKNLCIGDKIFAYLKGTGYVGYGEITQEATKIKDYTVPDENKTLLELPLVQPNAKENCDDPELCEWVVGVNWIKAFPREQAKAFKGVFANQNVVCKLRHEQTVQFLENEFGLSE